MTFTFDSRKFEYVEQARSGASTPAVREAKPKEPRRKQEEKSAEPAEPAAAGTDAANED